MIRTLDANYLSTSHLPRPASGPAPFHLVRPLGLVATGFVGDWWRTEITTDDDESSSIRLNRRREAIKPKVRGPLRYEILDY